jgi:hypothetical protein
MIYPFHSTSILQFKRRIKYLWIQSMYTFCVPDKPSINKILTPSLFFFTLNPRKQCNVENSKETHNVFIRDV